MPITNEIALRPRFKKSLNSDHDTVLKTFETLKGTNTTYMIVRVDDHIFIRLPKHLQHYWSPQLQLEINEVDQNTALLLGLFGPNPTVWAMFMFFHFLVAGLFIAFGIWTYANYTLDIPYALQLGVMLLMVVVWFILYFAGRYGRAKGAAEMQGMHDFMIAVLKSNRFI